MLTKLRTKISDRISTLGRSNQLYIIPTLDGIKLALLNLILLIIGLVYANNYVLLFNFILFCLFMGSMFYTHFNLQGLKLVSANLSGIHVGETGILSLNFQSSSGLGHHFISFSFQSPLIEQSDLKQTYSSTNTNQFFRISIPLAALKRGKSEFPRITMQTYFPFHLFKCFSYLDPKTLILCYPEKKDFNLHRELQSHEEKSDEGEDFNLREYRAGDPLKRVYWKKVAQSNRWYSKILITPDVAPIILSLSDSNLKSEEIERELSSICYQLYNIHSQGIKYGIELSGTYINPEHSTQHLQLCLKALAEYEA